MPLVGLLLSRRRGKGIGDMGRKRLLTPEIERKICERYEQVECARILVDEFGVSDQTIYRVLDKHGIPRTHRHPRPKGTGSNHKGIDRKLVGELYQSGLSVPSIANRLGCSTGTVYHHLDKLGLYKVGQRKVKHDALTPRILELHEQGLSDYEIADALGTSRGIVNYRILKAFGKRGRGRSFARECVCPRCGKRFTTMVKNQQFCSSACCNAAGRQKRDDEKRVNADGSVEEITLREIYDRDHGRCYICGRRTDWNDYRVVDGFKVVGPRYPSRDHVIALHNGGTHTRDNIRLAHRECNTLKSDKGQMRLAI